MTEQEKKSLYFKSDNADGIKGKAFLIVIMALMLVAGGITGAGIGFLYKIYKTLPSPDKIQHIEPALVSKVFSKDSTLLYGFSTERRFWVEREEIPPLLIKAVVATEDRRFYSHWGIDIKRIFGAMLVNLVRGYYAQGASTITQQLARNIHFTQRQLLIRKLREAMTAVQIERYFTKDQIIEYYMNQVYLGGGVYGIEAASRRFFSKHVTDLDLNECATLAGMIQLPEHYRPDKKENLERTRKRRAAVLRAMKEMKIISEKKMKEVSQSPVPSDPGKREARIAPYFIEEVRKYIERKYGEKSLYNGGLNIYTTLDAKAQKAAEDTMVLHTKWLQEKENRRFLRDTRSYRKIGISMDEYLDNFDSLYAEHKDEYRGLHDTLALRSIQSAVIAIDVNTGAIRVLIGGKDFSKSKFNRAFNARRQPGSSFKPFVYAAALENGYTPASVILDKPVTLETPEGLWKPENYEHEFHGPVTMRYALTKSINIPAIQTLMDIGADKVIQLARQMGLKYHLPPVPALAIGACETTPIEMASAYGAFADNGMKNSPYFIDCIVDKTGNTLEKHRFSQENVLDPQTSYLMTSLLQSVVTSGTGASIPREGFRRPAGGKTGTTNNYSDAWVVGFTPQVACAVWVGADERYSMGPGVTGARGAIPIWVKTMKTLHTDLPVRKFSRPKGIVSCRICGKTHKIAGSSCPDTYSEYFNEENLPDSCDVHDINSSKSGSSERMNIFGSHRKEKTTKKRKNDNLMF